MLYVQMTTNGEINMKTRLTVIIFFFISILAISCGSEVNNGNNGNNGNTDGINSDSSNTFDRHLWKVAVVDNADLAAQEVICGDDPMKPEVPVECYKIYFESLPEGASLIGLLNTGGMKNFYHAESPVTDGNLDNNNTGTDGNSSGETNNTNNSTENNTPTTGGESISKVAILTPKINYLVGASDLSGNSDSAPADQYREDPHVCHKAGITYETLQKTDSDSWKTKADCDDQEYLVSLSASEYQSVDYDYGNDNKYCNGVISKKISFSSYTFKFEPTSCLKMCDKYPEICN